MTDDLDESPVAEWMPFPHDAPLEQRVRAWCLCWSTGASADMDDVYKNAHKAESLIVGRLKDASKDASNAAPVAAPR